MSKSPDAFRTISEVAAQLDTPAHVLRFWESKFPQVKPVKRAGGRRYYRPDDIALLGGIKVLLHDQGMTIRGVQKLLRERGVRHVATLSALPWEGEEAPEEVAATPGQEPRDIVAEEGGESPEVVVGPWPGAGTEDPLPEEVDSSPAEAPARAWAVETFVAGVASRLAAPGEVEARAAPAEASLARLREALSRADRARLGAEAARLRPLVARLRALRREPLDRSA